MSRVRMWTGTEWKDVSFWDGSQWKPGYTPGVYGNVIANHAFNSNNEGWVTDGIGIADGPASWSSGYIKRPTNSNPYDTSYGLERVFNNTVYQLEPGTRVRMQASLAIPRTLETSGVTTETRVGCVFRYSVTFATQISGDKILGAAGTSSWQTVTTDELVIPDGKDPVDVTFDYMGVFGYGRTAAAVGPFDEFELRCTWAKLIDQDGAVLGSLTTPAVEHMRVWDSVGGVWA